ncbi:protein of unknown function [Vibrio tapetis subsp. tapetis]|uniref:Uncharacterized protein n=1 Tax=Vibrio tapetis subsp. tapetis TaxID=1671868 RepID=A0A2N8ZJB5_9VIBR|nr:protein of unknown function [Vibrio tapetis subsp. tapetis]
MVEVLIPTLVGNTYIGAFSEFKTDGSEKSNNHWLWIGLRRYNEFVSEA